MNWRAWVCVCACVLWGACGEAEEGDPGLEGDALLGDPSLEGAPSGGWGEMPGEAASEAVQGANPVVTEQTRGVVQEVPGGMSFVWAVPDSGACEDLPPEEGCHGHASLLLVDREAFQVGSVFTYDICEDDTGALEYGSNFTSCHKTIPAFLVRARVTVEAITEREVVLRFVRVLHQGTGVLGAEELCEEPQAREQTVVHSFAWCADPGPYLP